MVPDSDPESEPAGNVIRRIRTFSTAAAIVFVLFMLFRRDWYGVAGVACSAVVVLINFLWLEDVVDRVLKPDEHLRPSRLTIRAVARFLILGVALILAVFAARFSPLSVLLGFSVVVVGILIEAGYTVYRSLRGVTTAGS